MKKNLLNTCLSRKNKLLNFLGENQKREIKMRKFISKLLVINLHFHQETSTKIVIKLFNVNVRFRVLFGSLLNFVNN